MKHGRTNISEGTFVKTRGNMMSRFTTNYQLHQWDPEDNFLRTDFNTDLSKIDTALTGKADNSDITNLQNQLNKKVTNLQGQINKLPTSDAITNLQNQINTQQQQINSKPNSSAITKLQNQINTQKNQINTQQSQINSLSSGKAEFVRGTYTGNGVKQETQTIQLGFQPKAVFISGYLFSAMTTSDNCYEMIKITSSGFQVIFNTVYNPTPNANGVRYGYLAMR